MKSLTLIVDSKMSSPLKLIIFNSLIRASRYTYIYFFTVIYNSSSLSYIYIVIDSVLLDKVEAITGNF